MYVSFGTVIWRYDSREALAALEAIATALGGATPDPARVAALARPNVKVERYVDQWSVLREANVFVTHQGLNSTHEAIFHGVPMLSYPFFWDQPALAATCERLGLALPLAASPRGPIAAADVTAALDLLVRRRDAMRLALSRALEWERSTIAGRPAVVDRVLALASGSAVP